MTANKIVNSTNDRCTKYPEVLTKVVKKSLGAIKLCKNIINEVQKEFTPIPMRIKRLTLKLKDLLATTNKKDIAIIDPINAPVVLQNNIGVSCNKDIITVPRFDAPDTPNNQGSAIGF